MYEVNGTTKGANDNSSLSFNFKTDDPNKIMTRITHILEMEEASEQILVSLQVKSESKHLLHQAHGLLVSGKLEDQVEFKKRLGEYLGRDQHGSR